MTVDEIMALLTPQEQQHVSPENVAAVLRVLSASIADTAGTKPIYEIFAHRHSMTNCWEEVPKEFYDRTHREQRRIVYAAPPALSNK